MANGNVYSGLGLAAQGLVGGDRTQDNCSAQAIHSLDIHEANNVQSEDIYSVYIATIRPIDGIVV